MSIRVADYIFQYLADYGVTHVFLVTGGASMYLTDAIKKEKRLKYVTYHNEQACAIAAEGYSRTTGKMSVVCVTSGPGGLNTLTGVMGQWADSIPVLYLSGQVKLETVKDNDIRQLGDQEINIVDIVNLITKYSKMIVDPLSIKHELKTAIDISTSDRKGPVWLDIPLNIQSALIENFSFEDCEHYYIKKESEKIRETLEYLKGFERPLIIAGHGIRLSNAKKEFLNLLRYIDIPVVTTFNGFDLLSNDHPNFVGRVGTLGSRSGNFALQNADAIICMGTRNNIRQVSYDYKNFAKNAKKIIIDIDELELNKKTIQGDIIIKEDIQNFINEFNIKLESNFILNGKWLEWLNWCKDKYKKYPVVLNEYKNTKNNIHPYYFIGRLTHNLKENSIVVTGNGTACVSMFQAGIVKNNQRIFWNSGCASMGYALPASIGACFGNNENEVICIDGDGSFQMNLQELQTIKHYKLPIKIFILNNKGYHSIKQTQDNFFNGDYIGCNESSGVSFPDNKKLADLYDLKYFKINSPKDVDKKINKILKYKDSLLCEVMLPTDYIFSPKVSSERKEDGTIVSKPLEDMYPFLDRDEFNSNMILERDKI